MIKFNNADEVISFIKEHHATNVGMRVNNKTSIDNYVIGCIGVIGTIYTPDGEIRFTIGDEKCSIGRNTAERMIKQIRSTI